MEGGEREREKERERERERMHYSLTHSSRAAGRMDVRSEFGSETIAKGQKQVPLSSRVDIT
jgi:hypothetical protein